MAFLNPNGIKISYECEDLIEELKADIKEFGGGTIVIVWCEDNSGCTFYVNYDFIDEEKPINKTELKENEYLQQMTMTALLMLLEKQNELM